MIAPGRKFYPVSTQSATDRFCHLAKAECYFDIVLQKRPDDKNASFYRACCRMDLRKYEEAIADFTKNLLIYPKESRYLRGLCHYYLDHYKAALEDFEQELLLNPGNYDARQKRGHCFERMRQYDQAIREFTEVPKLKPQQAGTYRGRAFNYYMLHRHQEALADCDQAVRLDPPNCHGSMPKPTWRPPSPVIFCRVIRPNVQGRWGLAAWERG
jgi:tetratricopeptide (TPR) repeat protein